MELLYEAATIHREHHDPNVVQISTLISLKTGGSSEDCRYCPQAKRYHTDIKTNPFMTVADVKEQAIIAKTNGSSRSLYGSRLEKCKRRKRV